MYRTIKTLFGFSLILFFSLTSCEGRKSQSQALAEDIEEFKNEVSLQVDVYYPESYTERTVDTLLHNGFRVKIKTYSDMDNSVLFTKIKDTVNYQTYYRNFKYDILVEKDGKPIYSQSIDKQKANKNFGFRNNLALGSELYDFNTLAVLKSIEVNDNPNYHNMVVIDVQYAIPETDKISNHKIMIDNKGRSTFIKTKKQ